MGRRNILSDELRRRNIRFARRAANTSFFLAAAFNISSQLIAEQTNHLKEGMGVEATEDSAKFGRADVKGRVEAVFVGGESGDFGFVGEAGEGDYIGVVLDTTSYYAESGGQEADMGEVALGDGVVLEVADCQVFGGYILHIGTLVGGGVKVGGESGEQRKTILRAKRGEEEGCVDVKTVQATRKRQPQESDSG